MILDRLQQGLQQWLHPDVAPKPDTWAEKQRLAKPARYYGGGGTIHGTNHLDVEVNEAGQVVSVWFRCQMLPFQQVGVGAQRANEMTSASEHLPKITGVEVLDS